MFDLMTTDLPSEDARYDAFVRRDKAMRGQGVAGGEDHRRLLPRRLPGADAQA